MARLLVPHLAMRLFLVRHGETPWTRTRQYQGTTDVPLTPKGFRQAKAIAQALRREHPNRLYTSTLSRARETARRVGKALRLRPLGDARLNEISFGEWEGADYRRLAEEGSSPFRDWRRGKLSRPPGGESIASLARRIGQFLREILRRHPDETVAVISHGGPIKMFLFTALSLGARRAMPLPSLWSFRIDPASISLIEGDQSLLQIAWINRTDHLVLSL